MVFWLILEEKQTIVALGAGSITKRVYPDGRIERCDNVKDVGLYIEKIDEMIERKKKLLSEPLEGSMRKLLWVRCTGSDQAGSKEQG